MCADNNFQQRDGIVALKDCIKGTNLKGQQSFSLTWHKDIRIKGQTLCWDVSDPNDKADITLYPCHGGQGNQYWRYDVVCIVFKNNYSIWCKVKIKMFTFQETQWLIHGGNPRCLDCDPGRKKLYVRKCNEKSKTQKWRFEHVNISAIASWEGV